MKSPLTTKEKRLKDKYLLEQELATAITHALQLERLVWLLVQEAGGACVIDEAAVHPLWTTKFERVEGGAKTLVKISCDHMPEPTEADLHALADALHGKPDSATGDIMTSAGMTKYPPAYILARLTPIITCPNGVWTKL